MVRLVRDCCISVRVDGASALLFVCFTRRCLAGGSTDCGDWRGIGAKFGVPGRQVGEAC